MKIVYSAILVISLVTFYGCSKRENKLTAFNPEAFAFNIENGWEVNASVRVKGFQQNEQDKTYSAKLSYKANLISSDGKMLKTANDILEDENTEEFIDLTIEVQFELDSTYEAGNYKVEFLISDTYSGQDTKISKEFELAKE